MSQEPHTDDAIARDGPRSAQLDMNWQSAGFPPLHEWASELVAIARGMEVSPVPMVLLVGPQGMMLPNSPMKALLSSPQQREVTGRSILEILPECATMIEHAMSGVVGRSDRPILFSPMGESTATSFQLDFRPVVNRQGTVVGVQGVATDVTGLLDRIRVLSETTDRLQLALESSGMVGIWDLDVKTNISTADANVARVFGLPASICQRGIDDNILIRAIHDDDRGKVQQTLRTAIANRTSYRCRYRVIASDGQSRWVTTSGKPCFNDDGDLIRLLGVVVDVTDQVETARALKESRFQFETLTEALPQIVWSCDAEGRHDYFSRRWSEFTGIQPEDIQEHTWKQLVDPEHWEMVSTTWEKSRSQGIPYDIDYRFRHHSGEFRWLRVMALPIRNENGGIDRWFGTSTDVHAAYLASAERERLAQELERLATEDQLTEALTRRAFMTRAKAEVHHSAKRGSAIGLIMLDIDHFKTINDTYGHPGGDKVLAIVAQRIKNSVDKADLFGRIGGEEFCIMLSNCMPFQTQVIAERIRQRIHLDPVSLDDGQEINVTISLGATARVPSASDLDHLLMIADKALYSAKKSGRNRSVFHSDRLSPL